MSQTLPTGMELLQEPSLNKGTAFTAAERDALGLHGLLPPRIFTMEEQIAQVFENLARKPNDLEKYIFLASLKARNETLFYRALQDNLDELMPIIYTPTVGQACEEYGEIFRHTRGLFVTIEDRGRVREVLRNWPERDVRVIVVTDGERILGLGDLGANGMGIPVGKLALYTACAGVNPNWCLPVTLDVGTDNERLRHSPWYLGRQQPRTRGEAYDALVEEFMEAVKAEYPHALVQLEDFGNRNAFRLIERYRDRFCTFNDDIQGTAAVALSGVYSALKLTRRTLSEQRFLFFGAGEAGIGIAELLVSAMVEEGLSEADARARCWFMDSKGLVVKGRTDLSGHKQRFAQEHPGCADGLSAVEAVRPTALIGVSGQPGVFTRPMLEALSRINEQPLVFALSNPTSRSECSADNAYAWTNGRAIFASGSPYGAVQVADRTLEPGQANNAYIFPGVGLGVVGAQAKHVTNEMFSAAAKTLSAHVTEADLEVGRIFPALSRVREVSLAIAEAVAEVAFTRGLAGTPRPKDLRATLRALMYEPNYRDYAAEQR